MSGWDEGQVYYDHPIPVSGLGQDNTALYQDKFLRFIREFRQGANAFIYRDALKQNYNLKKYFLEVQFEDLTLFDEPLANELQGNPNDLLPLFEAAASKAAAQLHRGAADEQPRDIQILLASAKNPLPLRDLTSNHISTLVRVPGIVISASKLQAKVIRLSIECRQCHHKKLLFGKPGFGSIDLPLKCDVGAEAEAEKCPPTPYIIVSDECRYIDQQVLKVQESPETVPTGEMPRHMLATLDRALVGTVAPGTRVVLVGVYTVFASQERGAAEAVRHPYVRCFGVQRNLAGAGRATFRFEPSEERMFARFARRADAYDIVARSIAPSLYGHDDCKRAVACLLFGGTRKALPDGTRLRGDINVLLLGDPGTGKSQLLKFVEKVAPIGVYTSGKGSSAAGLTASVIRDRTTREFYLEGGAMVMADGGVVCIDEFDKMHLRDRVAIHEAMEQQTISIAKAGITTILNSRTSVLAAANPVHGRYDTLKSADDNIDFQATILSRFDMIFIIKDVRDRARDNRMAHHVIELHTSATGTRRRTNATDADDDDAAAAAAAANDDDDDNVLDEMLGESGEIPIDKLKRYVAYARLHCAPRLDEEAAEALQNHYVGIRAKVREREVDGNRAVIPITVRQLEAIVRIAESLAKISLSPVANKRHVEEAMRLFKVSTMEASTSGNVASETMTAEMMADVETVETRLRQRLPIGHSTTEAHCIADFVRQGLAEPAVRRAIAIMMQRDELEYRQRRRMIFRKK